jgi:hypothetical protein
MHGVHIERNGAYAADSLHVYGQVLPSAALQQVSRLEQALVGFRNPIQHTIELRRRR